MAQILAYGIGGALVPMSLIILLFNGFLRPQKLNRAAAEVVKAIRAADVTVQAGGLELRQNVNLINLAVDAIGDGNVDESIFAAQRNSGLRAVRRQRQQPSAASTAQNQRHDVSHRWL